MDALKFCHTILSNYESFNINLIKLVDNFSSAYSRLKTTQPYHINIIEELHANENANSRILAALFRYRDNGDYVILKSFIDSFLGAKFDINDPIITTEELRIDLLVREPGKYAIIFENKLFDAVLQKNQIARYIIKLQNQGYKDEQIYVVFLPPYEYDTNACSWQRPQPGCNICDDCANCKLPEPSLRTAFSNRYHIVTFRDDITQWLKTTVIPNCKQKEAHLYSASIQYLDYLEGYFNLRNNTMNRKLQELIRDQLNLDSKATVLEQLNVLRETSNGIQNLLNEIFSMQDVLRDTIMANWKQDSFSNFKELRPMQKGNIIDITLGPIDGRNVTVLINEEKQQLYVQAEFDNNLPEEQRIITDTKLMQLHDILPDTNPHCIWKYLGHYDLIETYTLFKDTVARCKHLIDK